MTIIGNGPATANGRHDPYVCGLGPETDCPACRREEADRAQIDRLTPAWLRLWNRLRQQFTILRRLWRSEQPPDPMPAVDLARLIRSVCDPQYREPIAAALAPEIYAIAREAVRAELQRERGGQ